MFSVCMYYGVCVCVCVFVNNLWTFIAMTGLKNVCRLKFCMNLNIGRSALYKIIAITSGFLGFITISGVYVAFSLYIQKL